MNDRQRDHDVQSSRAASPRYAWREHSIFVQGFNSIPYWSNPYSPGSWYGTLWDAGNEARKARLKGKRK